jgi:hypothetical protein
MTAALLVVSLRTCKLVHVTYSEVFTPATVLFLFGQQELAGLAHSLAALLTSLAQCNDAEPSGVSVAHTPTAVPATVRALNLLQVFATTLDGFAAR